jgi:hypothetical protein
LRGGKLRTADAEDGLTVGAACGQTHPRIMPCGLPHWRQCAARS